MELFLPSLLLFILAAILILGVYPYMSPFILAILAALTLGIAVYHHKQFFQDEYSTITWKDAFQGSSGSILIGLVVVLIVGWLLNLAGRWIFQSKKTTPTMPVNLQKYIQGLSPTYTPPVNSMTPSRNVGSTAFYRKYFS
jgi:predicted PurR-regulated permease PerM